MRTDCLGYDHAMQCMMEETNQAKKAKPSNEVMEGLVAGGAARTEHIEIAAYALVIEMARAVDQRAVRNLQSRNPQYQGEMLPRVNTLRPRTSQQSVWMISA